MKETSEHLEGMVYNFRGRSIYRKFDDLSKEDEQCDDDDVGIVGKFADLRDTSVDWNVEPLSRSRIPRRRLFPDAPKSQLPSTTPLERVPKEQHGDFDTAEPENCARSLHIAHSKGRPTSTFENSPRFRPLGSRKLEIDLDTKPAGAVVETKKTRSGRLKDLDTWVRAKANPMGSSISKKRDADTDSFSDIPPAKKRLRSYTAQYRPSATSDP